MFDLDHLATRMRRNDENLLVLAGVDSSPPRTTDALVADALRAAQSEVESYDRIEFGLVDSDVGVVAAAVNDVVRLVAELFDNAARFSPPASPVVCEARRLGDYMIIHIEDRGVGMASDLVQRLNDWIARPPTVEATTFRQMGLAVVARLAARYQIQVELRSRPGYGTVAYVMLPATILVMPRSRHARPDLTWPASSPVDITQRLAPYRAAHGAVGAPAAAVTAYPAPVGAPPSGNGFNFWTTPHGQQPQPYPTGSAPDGGHWPTQTDPPQWQGLAYASQWQTPADPGWRAAAAAAHPVPQGTTRAGLPKRVPQGQLVPGSVADATAPLQAPRRSPEDSRGLLSSYQRGLQRGREHGPH
jgi:hypothetical protein